VDVARDANANNAKIIKDAARALDQREAADHVHAIDATSALSTAWR